MTFHCLRCRTTSPRAWWYHLRGAPECPLCGWNFAQDRPPDFLNKLRDGWLARAYAGEPPPKLKTEWE